MGALVDFVIGIFFILLLIGFIGAMWDASKNKNYRRYIIYKSMRKRNNKKKHRH